MDRNLFSAASADSDEQFAAQPSSGAPPSLPTPRAVSMPRADWTRLRGLPWGVPLDDWPAHGVQPLTIRRGESRHPVLFVEAGHRRYAIKETSPRAAAHEIAVFRELRQRDCPTLEPVGSLIVPGAPIPSGVIAG